MARRRPGPAFDLERFEAIAVGEQATLLHVAGRWRSRRLSRVPDPALVAGVADGEQILEALPDPGALPAFADVDPPPWRAGFALRGSHVPGTRYALRTADGRGEYELPQPTLTVRAARADGTLSRKVTELESQLEAAGRRLEGKTSSPVPQGRVADIASLEALRARRAALAQTERRLQELRAGLQGQRLVPDVRLAAIAAAAARRAQQVGAIETRLGELRAALERERRAP